MPSRTVNGSVLAAYSIRVRLSDRSTSPPHPNPKDRNRRNQALCTGMTMKRTIITSGMMIRKTNRVTVAKRGRALVERAAQPSGSGRRYNSSHHQLHHPLNRPPGVWVGVLWAVRCRLFAWPRRISRPRQFFLFFFVLPQFSPPHVPLGLVWTLSWVQNLLYVYIYHMPTFSTSLFLCWVSRTALLHIHFRKFETNTYCYRSCPGPHRGENRPS